MSDNSIVALVVIFLLVLAFMILVGPIFTIWSLNTLFGLEIAYSFKTWVAVNWMMLVLHGFRASIQKKQNNN